MMGTDPYAKNERRDDSGLGLQLFKQIIQICGGVVGVIAMVVGLVYAAKMLKLLLEALSAAAEGTHPVMSLAEMLGGPELVWPTEFGAVPLAVPFAIVLLVAALVVVGWLSLGLILTGAKVLTFCLGDREAMKELLAYALGLKKTPDGKTAAQENIQ
jgi:hypothetical protein